MSGFDYKRKELLLVIIKIIKIEIFSVYLRVPTVRATVYINIQQNTI